MAIFGKRCWQWVLYCLLRRDLTVRSATHTEVTIGSTKISTRRQKAHIVMTAVQASSTNSSTTASRADPACSSISASSPTTSTTTTTTTVDLRTASQAPIDSTTTDRRQNARDSRVHTPSSGQQSPTGDGRLAVAAARLERLRGHRHRRRRRRRALSHGWLVVWAGCVLMWSGCRMWRTTTGSIGHRRRATVPRRRRRRKTAFKSPSRATVLNRDMLERGAATVCRFNLQHRCLLHLRRRRRMPQHTFQPAPVNAAFVRPPPSRHMPPRWSTVVRHLTHLARRWCKRRRLSCWPVSVSTCDVDVGVTVTRSTHRTARLGYAASTGRCFCRAGRTLHSLIQPTSSSSTCLSAPNSTPSSIHCMTPVPTANCTRSYWPASISHTRTWATRSATHWSHSSSRRALVAVVQEVRRRTARSQRLNWRPNVTSSGSAVCVSWSAAAATCCASTAIRHTSHTSLHNSNFSRHLSCRHLRPKQL